MKRDYELSHLVVVLEKLTLLSIVFIQNKEGVYILKLKRSHVTVNIL